MKDQERYAKSDIYQCCVTDSGRVFRIPSMVEIKSRDNGHGYRQVDVRRKSDGVWKTVYVHRLVAAAFIDNRDNKPHVNHKDGNKCNNCADNLEWVTRSENQKHRFTVLGQRFSEEKMKDITDKAAQKHRKPVICMETGIQYKSAVDAARMLNIPRGTLSGCLGKRLKKAGGYTWGYVNENK